MHVDPGPGGGGGGTPRSFWWGVCCILNLCQTKLLHFPYPFLDLTSIIHTRFQTSDLAASYQMIFFGYFSFSLFSFKMKGELLIRSRGSLKSYTQFQTKVVKIYTGFQTKMAQTPYPQFGATHRCIVHVGEYPSGLAADFKQS